MCYSPMHSLINRSCSMRLTLSMLRRVQNKMPNYYFATITLHRQTSLDRMIDDAMTTGSGHGSGRGTPTSSSAGCAPAPKTLRWQ